MKRRFLLGCVMAVIFAVMSVLNLFLVPFAAAQEVKPKDKTAVEEQAQKALELETMTVTAQKKEENVQDVPMSISVFSHIQLEDAGIDNIFELTRFTPNMFMKNNTFESEVIIRGICAPGGSLYGPAGFYVDDVSYSIPYMRNPALFDIERIEVLKGPQGTLFWGKNIFDKEYASNGGQVGPMFMGLDGKPRMIGATLTYRF